MLQIAHRGLWGPDIPENSMAAFHEAAKAGFGIELDVHLAADGVPVVFHDSTLERMTGLSSKVFEETSGTLGQITLGTSEETISTLAEVVAAFPLDLPIFVEVKPPHTDSPWQARQTAEAVLKACQVEGALKPNIRLMSFSSLIMDVFLSKAPKAQVGCLAAEQDTRPVKRSLTEQAGFAAVWREDVATARKILGDDGPRLYTWTIKSMAQQTEVSPYVNGVIFEGYAAP